MRDPGSAPSALALPEQVRQLGEDQAVESELDGSWVRLRLRGRRTNRFGVGARIRVTAVDPAGAEITRRYHMDNKTGFGSAPYLAHVGLPGAVEIREIEVFWPASGCRGTYRGELGALLELDEADCIGETTG